jgi:hypothetical protein
MSRSVTCPACGREISRADVRSGDFPCPHCLQTLEIDTRYALPAELVSLVLAASLSALVGISGYMFLLSTVLISVPIFLVAALLNRWFWLKLARSNYGVDFRITGPRDSPKNE